MLQCFNDACGEHARQWCTQVSTQSARTGCVTMARAPEFGEMGGAPKGGRHSTIVVSTKCIRSVQWQPDGLTIHTNMWFLGAGFLRATPISLKNGSLVLAPPPLALLLRNVAEKTNDTNNNDNSNSNSNSSSNIYIYIYIYYVCMSHRFVYS